MTTQPTDRPSFNSLTVAAFESRHAAEMARLIESYGGKLGIEVVLLDVRTENDIPAAFEMAKARDVNTLLVGIDALIQEHGTTTVLFAGDRCTVAASGELIIAIGAAT